MIEFQTEHVMAGQSPYLQQLDSLAGWQRWRDILVTYNQTSRGIGGCPLGSLASELAEHSESARELLAQSFKTWEGYISDGLRTMRDRGDTPMTLKRVIGRVLQPPAKRLVSFRVAVEPLARREPQTGAQSVGAAAQQNYPETPEPGRSERDTSPVDPSALTRSTRCAEVLSGGKTE